MRLFIAVLLSKNLVDPLIKSMHDLKTQGVDGNFVPAKNLHITLAFLGETDQPARVKDIMKAVPFQPFRIALTDPVTMGGHLAIGVKGNQKFKSYVNALRSELDKNGITYDKQKFNPHVTILRKPSYKKPYKVAVPKEEMTVEKISLMKSEEKNGKSVYTEVFSVGANTAL